MTRLMHDGVNPLYTKNVQFTRSVQESKAINELYYPSIIVSANGMATGGRILHHLAHRITDARNSVVFVGFQAAGTRGRTLLDGARIIRIMGIDYPVRAQIHEVDSFSAHADYKEILQWLEGFETAPRRTFLVHGEPRAAGALKEQIEAAFKSWSVEVPGYLETFEL
jgi:metallo-beta-lactamase family protein